MYNIHTNLYSAKDRENESDAHWRQITRYLRYGGVVNKQIKKGLLLSLWVKKYKNRWIFGKVTSKDVIVSCIFFVF